MNPIKVIEDIQKSMYSKEMVLKLTNPTLTDYEKGKVQGKIETLNFLLQELKSKK